jgi:hypothetical protein
MLVLTMARRSLLLPFLLAVALGATAASCAEGGESARHPGWRLDPVWDDGQAELCFYDVLWARYGRHYPGQARLVLVKEPWAPDLEVKADRPRPDGFEVLKLNHQRSVPTGIYTYHQMASVFLRRDDGEVRKIATSSAEDCGLSTGHMVEGRLEVRSYFDGVGERILEWPPGALPEDGLPALLRDFLLAPTPPARVRVVPSLLDSRLADLEPRDYLLARRDGPAVELSGEGRVETLELHLGGAQPELTYRFDRRPPHRLVELHTSAGTRYRLVQCERIAYWLHNAPGGERWLPPAHRPRPRP